MVFCKSVTQNGLELVPKQHPFLLQSAETLMAKLLKLRNPLQGHVTDGEHFGRKMENE